MYTANIATVEDKESTYFEVMLNDLQDGYFANSSEIQNLKSIASELRGLFPDMETKISSKNSFIFIDPNHHYDFDLFLEYVGSKQTKFVPVNRPLTNKLHSYGGYFVYESYLKVDTDWLFSVVVESGLHNLWQINWKRSRIATNNAVYKPEPLALLVVEQVFYLCCTMLGISLFVFCVELCILMFHISKVNIRAFF